jgi:alkanesulfonate monooxygenase SsuD/methylene tetrahydromethanopterin reductase-like flavin-dependent oxidoreductase (luciferase family)
VVSFRFDTALLILSMLDRESIALAVAARTPGGRGEAAMRVGVWMPNAMPFGLERSFFLDWVRLADDAGFDTLSTVDRPNYDLWDPLASLAAAAAVTEQIRLATTTQPLPNRNEVLVAKQAAVIDRLSGGRLTLGVSLGSRPDDYQVFGATLSIA